MKIIIVKNYEAMSAKAAELLINVIKEKPNAILGLATGGTPEGMYAKLIKSNQAKETDWSNLTTFNLDEYVGIPTTHKMSYHTYMHEKLFDHVNIKQSNVHVPNGEGDPNVEGPHYDQTIDAAGGVDLQVLGIGQNAHIAFNEPGSKDDDGTHEVELTESTINANSRYFASKDDVPKTAMTMGIGTIMKAKQIILLASGENKAQAIYDAVKGSITSNVPASFLQNHPNVTLIVDKDAARLINK